MQVWVNGTFDVMHIGHIKLLEHASKFGVVRVGLDTDERIQTKKGINRPVNKLEDRVEFIKSIRYVDSVVSFSTNDELENRIKEWGSDIIVIGNDYKYHEIIGADLVKKIIYFNKIDGKSTTNILKHNKKN